MKVVLTGASGFIGGYVLAELLDRGTDVVVATRNPGVFDTNQQAKVVTLDISAPGEDLYDRLDRPDVLIHLAWDGLPNYHSLHHFETELPAQYHFIKKAVESGLSSVVIAGTCFEYGMQAGELTEKTICQPENAYALAKDTLRRQLQLLTKTTSFNLTWARLFYMYGSRQQSNSLFAQLRSAVQRGDKVFNMSKGEQLRDYLPVETVASALVKLSERQNDADIVNICSGKPVSIRALVESWLEHYGWDIQLNLGYYPYPDYEPLAFWGSTDKLVKLVGAM
ncbi:NAD(P)-dependent oxidoreductase [Exilibacterium tricleocarpae]|uniref:NAD(P)-dependent oxidoreductase n=1 Tax=Exilibacterium tricleocarpae TaxID=2591008 RepID=A0A545TQG5_9GAMM|nr:NAD(P)-dependent oxidoreductase [Exilibacterium tricleocarpae]TQV79466.1 NAD(P)-dependent oxidoreductase [Exilibacterium tricleocarpae]